MVETKVTRNYQITLPKEVRKQYGIGIGDTVQVFPEGSHIAVLKKSREQILKEAAGIWKDFKGDSVEYVRKMRAEYKNRARRLGI